MSDWVEQAVRFVEEHPPPLRAPVGSRTPRSAGEHRAWTEWTEQLHAAGLATLHWPSTWGGAGASVEESRGVLAVLAAAGAPLPLSDIGVGMVGPAIAKAGTAAQQQRHLPPIVAGSVVWVQLFSEPEAGSDLASLRTRATRHGEFWRINGQKVWNTYGHIAQWGLLLARTGSPDERHRGLTAFLLPMDAPGVTVRPIREITGDADFNEVFLDDVQLADNLVLGTPGQGWLIAMDLLAEERMVTGRNVIGLRAELDRLAEATASVTSDPVMDHRLGQLCAAATALMSTVAAATPGSEPLAKILFSELNVEVHQFALDLLALHPEVAPGWPDRWADNYWYARAYTISGGANEVLRGVVAKRTLKVGTAAGAPAGVGVSAGQEMEADAVAKLLASTPDDDRAWSALDGDGWCDLVPTPGGPWTDLPTAVEIVRLIAAAERPLPVTGRLAAGGALADVDGQGSRRAMAATDPVRLGEHLHATAWGRLRTGTEMVVGPENGHLYRVESDLCRPLVTPDPDRGGRMATTITIPVGALQSLTDDPRLVERHVLRCAILLAAEALGAAQRALTMTLGHLAVRRQFGTVLGQFQALQHRAADMYGWVLLISNALDAAVADFDGPDGPLATWSLKSLAGEKGPWVIEQAIQLHGGSGFTWDTGLHWSLLRAQAARLRLGGPSAAATATLCAYRVRNRPQPTDWSRR